MNRYAGVRTNINPNSNMSLISRGVTTPVIQIDVPTVNPNSAAEGKNMGFLERAELAKQKEHDEPSSFPTTREDQEELDSPQKTREE